MDLELLNFWINRLNFDYKNNQLFVLLPSNDNDIFNTYCLKLSEDTKQILKFFGFDVTIKYDKLTLNNMFEYLCTSTKLDPRYIEYYGFKGPHSKNLIHAKFDKYLKNKNYPRDTRNLEEDSNKLLQEAIIYFNKSEEFDKYKNHFNILNKLFKQKDKLDKLDKLNTYKDFKKFSVLYGIYNIINYDDDILKIKWQEFKSEHWSGLKYIIH